MAIRGKTSAPVAPSPAPKPKLPVLSEGAKGPDVGKLQKLLIAAGAKIVADSHFGPRTKAAVVAFQKARKLAADGIVGPRTWEALTSN